MSVEHEKQPADKKSFVATFETFTHDAAVLIEYIENESWDLSQISNIPPRSICVVRRSIQRSRLYANIHPPHHFAKRPGDVISNVMVSDIPKGHRVVKSKFEFRSAKIEDTIIVLDILHQHGFGIERMDIRNGE